MSNKMFCFQCEQSAGCTGCTGAAGVCGKSAAAANLQDELTGSLIGLARAAEHAEPSSRTHRIMTEGLFTTITNVNFNEETLRKQVENCPPGERASSGTEGNELHRKCNDPATRLPTRT